jgi:glucose 1-dehydrogenase
MLAQTLALVTVICVNVVSPGMTHTRMTTKIYAHPRSRKQVKASYCCRGLGTPTDIANVIEFLVGLLSGYVTGQDICVEGGFSKSILSHIPG